MVTKVLWRMSSGSCSGSDGSSSSVALAQIYRGIIPFVILQLLGLIALLAWPDLGLWLARDSY